MNKEQLNKIDEEFDNNQIFNNLALFEIEEIKNFLHSKLQEAYELGREDERERNIEIMNNLEAPDCIDDNCEYIHDGYFKALEDLTKSLQTNKE